jgi:hypothetical protein
MVCPFVLKLKQHHRGFVGLRSPRERAARSKAARRAPRSGAELHKPRRGAEASGLERGARAGRSPHARSRSAVLLNERTRNELPTVPAVGRRSTARLIARLIGSNRTAARSRNGRGLPDLSALRDHRLPSSRGRPVRGSVRRRCALRGAAVVFKLK